MVQIVAIFTTLALATSTLAAVLPQYALNAREFNELEARHGHSSQEIHDEITNKRDIVEEKLFARDDDQLDARKIHISNGAKKFFHKLGNVAGTIAKVGLKVAKMVIRDEESLKARDYEDAEDILSRQYDELDKLE